MRDTRVKKNGKELKRNEDSDSSDDNSVRSDSESDEEQMNMHEYRKFVNKIFPSKFLTKKIKKDSANLEDSLDDESEAEEEISTNKSSKKKNKNNKKKPKKNIVESEEEEDDEEAYETIDEESEEEDSGRNRGKKGFNIIFTIGDPTRDEEEDSDYDEEEDSDYDEEEDSDDDDEPSNTKSNHESLEKQLETIDTIRKTFNDILEKDKTNVIAIDGLKELETREKSVRKNNDKRVKGVKSKNTSKFKNLINKKNLMNDYKFFKDKLSVEEQKKVIREVEEINKVNIVQKPYRLTLLESDIPVHLKTIALNKIASLRYMDPGNGEYYKIKNWVDTFMQIPFNTHKSLPISIDDGIEKCHNYMENAKSILDTAVYGMNDAKLQIMQMVGQWISNPKAIGNAIAIKGPMGTGKTTLVKEGISKILNRDFAFIALGGATDSSFLEGHSYTYEGSTWGKIVDILVKTKSMNPVIYFDELDKISDTPKGEEIAGILTHLTDTSQNSQFHDKYFSEIDFDLSKCLFIFSYNDESKVNPILLDRMYKIQTAGYEKQDKRIISKDYLIPTILQQVNFKDEDIIIPNETIDYIVETYTNEEKGVRNLKRCLEIIYTKLNLYRLMKPGASLFEKEMALKVEFPFTVTKDVMNSLIKRDDDSRRELFNTLYI
ncbi:AAA family ATPase [Flavobacteriaceae bacterium]|nr:AAA family ATPase [Flavobacteriaceae bacterium]